MKIWLDAHLSPRLARWLTANCSVEAMPLRELGLRDAEDEHIFQRARTEGAVIITKDADFVRLQERMGAPPKIIWLTCGNTSEERLQQIFSKHFGSAMQLLDGTDDLVEISGS